MNNYKLYVHICPNGKKYYGITKMEPKKRWNYGNGYRTNPYFTNAIKKYGWNNIEHIILFDSLTEYEAKELEKYYIQWYQTADRKYGYNISLGGDGSNHSEETLKKLSEIKKGKNNPNYGNGNKIKGKNNPKAKSVICLTTKKIFSTVKEGGQYYNTNDVNITANCKNRIKSAGKYNGQKLVWKYVNYKHDKVFKIKAM